MEGMRLEEDDRVSPPDASYGGPPSPPSRSSRPTAPPRPSRLIEPKGSKGKEKSHHYHDDVVYRYDYEDYEIGGPGFGAEEQGGNQIRVAPETTMHQHSGGGDEARNRQLVLGVWEGEGGGGGDDSSIKSLPTLHQLIMRQDASGVQALLGRLPPSSLPHVMAETIQATGATPLHVCGLLPARPPASATSLPASSAQQKPLGSSSQGGLDSLTSRQQQPQLPRDMIADLLLAITFQSHILDQILLACCGGDSDHSRHRQQSDGHAGYTGPVGETVLHIAARSGFDGLIRKVFEHLFKMRREEALSASPSVGGMGSNGTTSTASSSLVDWDGFVNRENARGQTALHVAANSGHYDCCMTLVANGAAVDWEDADHCTAYDLALQQHHDEVVKLLRSEGATIPRLYHYPQQLTEEERANLVVDDYGWIVNGDPERGPTPRGSNAGSSRRRSSSRSKTNAVPATTTTSLTSAASSFVRIPEKQLKLDAKRTKKWEKMLKEWSEHEQDKEKRKKKWKKVQKRARKGIPPQVRGQAWIRLTEAHLLIANPPIKYDPRKTGSRFLKQIDLDVARTHRDHILYKVRYSEKQCQLFRLLRAYSLHNKAVGYTQGMSSIAAMLLTFINDEEEAFWVFDSLMRDYAMSDLYRPGFPGLKKNFFIFERLLRHFLPRLYAHFEEQMIITSAYATKWFLMIFMNLPYGTTVRLWDYVFCEGYRAIFFVGISLLREFEGELLSREMEGIFLLLGNELSDRQLSPDRIIRGAVKLRRKAKKHDFQIFQELEQEYANDEKRA